jgi:uncharacterized membrane protein
MTSIPQSAYAAGAVRIAVAGAAALALTAIVGALSGRPPRLEPIAEATPAIQIHLAAVAVALAIGAWQFVGPKGTGAHRALGWTWSLAMMAAATSSFFIREIFGGSFSPIHLLSAITLVSLPAALWAAHRGDVRSHARGMTRIYLGGMIVAGGFAFMPGRLLWRVFFG